jgi:hypothetical protein
MCHPYYLARLLGDQSLTDMCRIKQPGKQPVPFFGIGFDPIKSGITLIKTVPCGPVCRHQIANYHDLSSILTAVGCGAGRRAYFGHFKR